METLLSAEQLAAGIDRLAREVRRETEGGPLTVIGVLTGAIMVVADLIRRLEGPVQLGMVWASSYRYAATALPPDFVGFDIPDAFVVGYGLDFGGRWRHLPYLAVLGAEDIAWREAAAAEAGR